MEYKRAMKRTYKRNLKKKKIKKIIKWTASLLLFLFVLLSGFTIYLKFKVDKVVDKKIEYKTTLRKETPEATEPIGVLLIGTDGGTGRSLEEGERSDTLIYATVNPLTKKTHLYSISRDLYTWVDDNNYQKINSAYSIGKEAQAAKAVEKLLDVPVDYYVSVNMDALSQVVDTLGGINVNNQLGINIFISDTEPNYTAIVEPGEQHINGDQALVYARMRYHDPEGDVGRQKRQQEVIHSVITEIKKPSSLLKLDSLLNIVANNIKTNANTNKIVELFKSYIGALSNISSTNIIGRGEMINGIYYMIVGKNNIYEIQNQIKSELGFPESEKVSWDEDENMLFIDDNVLPIDPGTHYDFPGLYNIFSTDNSETETSTEPEQTETSNYSTVENSNSNNDTVETSTTNETETELE